VQEIIGNCKDDDCDGDIDCEDSDCTNDPLCVGGGGEEPECTDADEDGFAIEGGDCGLIDCDDTNSNINPGADEICDNQIDDDCDDDIDCDDSDCSEDSSCVSGEEPEPECESGETQPCDTEELGICATGTQTCSQEGFWGECVRDNEPVTEICDNDLDDDCDGLSDEDDPDCQIVYLGGGGITFGTVDGGGPVSLIIFNEKNEEVLSDTVTVSWSTNKPATSRVIYDTVSHSALGSTPNYGYVYSTPEDSDKVTSHTVKITGLIPCTTYYWRAISHESPEVLGDEIVFTTECHPEEGVGEEAEEEISLEEIEKELKEIEESIEKISEKIEGMIPSQVLPEVPVAETEIEEVSEEIVEEEKFEAEELKKEEKPKTDLEKFLAAIGSFFNLGNLCWLSLFILIILIILFLLSLFRKQKRNEWKKEKKQWILPLFIFILIILYCFFCCSNCWILLLITAILIILFLLLEEKKQKEERQSKIIF